MKYIPNDHQFNARMNMALEEYVVNHLPKDDYFFFHVNDKSILIGKNQNTLEEINAQFCQDNNITIVRRLSGGGTVFTDLGVLCFNFVTDANEQTIHNFKRFAEPVIKALNELGIPAQQSGRNDILVNDKKVSGLAQYTSKDRMFNHGTLLVDCDMSEIGEALKVDKVKYASRGIKSVRARVANVKDFSASEITVSLLKKVILKHINPEEVYELTEEDWQKITEIYHQRFNTDEWNYGKSPKFDYEKKARLSNGTVKLHISTQKGKITQMKLSGDFFGVSDISELTQLLIGTMFNYQALEAKLHEINLENYLSGISAQELLHFIFDEA